MELNGIFFVNSILLGVGLAMDAFSVSLANGLNEPDMRKSRMCSVASVFALFQAVMPMIGWIIVRTIARCFGVFERMIPWIALILLSYIGGKMLYDGIKGNNEEAEKVGIGFKALMIQGIATSIDALSVGFTISEYDLVMALICVILIAVVTFIICIAGLALGRKLGTQIAGKAGILGGVILIGIGIEIFIKGVFF